MKDYPLIRITIVFISGILFQRAFDFDPPNILIPLLIVSIFSALIILKKFIITDCLPPLTYFIIVSCMVFLVSVYSSMLASASIKHYPFEQSKITDALVSGKITSIDLNRNYEIRFYLEAETVKISRTAIKLDHTFICRIRDDDKAALEGLYNTLESGNRVLLKCTISKFRGIRNPGEFDYQQYYESKGICAQAVCREIADLKITGKNTDYFNNWLFHIRKSIYGYMLSLHDYRTASLLKGLLLADRSDISKDVENDFINTGVVHVLAVSGLHIVYIMIIFVFLFGRLGIIARSVLIMLGLIMFLLLTGFLPSILRAVLMSFIIAAAYLSNRSNDVRNSLCLSALIILIFDPGQLFDAGFQLSYVSVLAIIVLVPFFTYRIKAMNIKYTTLRRFLLFASVTISAQIGTLPFTLMYFGKLSLVFLPANLIIIPLSGLIIAIGIFTIMAAPLSFWFAGVYAQVNIYLTSWLYKITALLSDSKYSYLQVSHFTLSDGIVLALIAVVFFTAYKKMETIRGKIFSTVIIIANAVLFTSLDKTEFMEEGRLTIISIDVSQGDSFLIGLPDGKTILIDAGQTNEYFDMGERVIIPLIDYLGVKKIDYGFISHLDADHYTGFITMIEEKRIGCIIRPGKDTSDPADEKLERFINKRHVTYKYFKNRLLLEGKGYRVYYLPLPQYYQTTDRNDRSAIIKIQYGNISALFTGDLGFAGEKVLIESYGSRLRSDILKISHHGSSECSSSEFLETVKPEFALISAGEYNRFNHPAKETLERILKTGSKILRTDKTGAVILQSDGRTIWEAGWREK